MTDNKRPQRLAATLSKHVAEVSSRQLLLRAESAEFRRRYFSWCLFECERERLRNFESVKLVRHPIVSVFLEYVGGLNDAERCELLTSLIKRLHAQQTLTTRERAICDKYVDFFKVPFVHPGGEVLSSMRVPDTQLRLQQRFLDAEPDRRSIAKLLKNQIKAAVASDLGILLTDTTQELSYEKQSGDWKLVTTFEFRGRTQLRYSHAFYALPGAVAGANVSGGVSVLNWMGIAPETAWSWLLLEDIPPVAESIRRLCTNFVLIADAFVLDIKNPLSPL